MREYRYLDIYSVIQLTARSHINNQSKFNLNRCSQLETDL